MKRTKHAEEKIIGVVKQMESGRALADGKHTAEAPGRRPLDHAGENQTARCRLFLFKVRKVERLLICREPGTRLIPACITPGDMVTGLCRA